VLAVVVGGLFVIPRPALAWENTLNLTLNQILNQAQILFLILIPIPIPIPIPILTPLQTVQGLKPLPHAVTQTSAFTALHLMLWSGPAFPTVAATSLCNLTLLLIPLL